MIAVLVLVHFSRAIFLPFKRYSGDGGVQPTEYVYVESLATQTFLFPSF